MMYRLMVFWYILFCLNLTNGIVREYYMDGPSTCGQTIIIYDNIINLAARSPISTPNPPPICTTTLRSGYTDSYYYIKVEWTATIKDCAFALNIYGGTVASGAPIKSFRCLGDQENTGIIEVRESDITVHLTQARDLFQPHNTFNLRITTYRDPSAPEKSEGTSKLPTGAVIGIVIGLFALIVFCILMCWLYKQGKLMFLEKKSLQSYRERGGVTGKPSNIFHSAHGGSTGYIESSAGSELSLSSKNWDNQQMWASLTHTPTMGRKVKPVSTPIAPPLPSIHNTEKSVESDSQSSIARDIPAMSSSAQRGRRRTKSTDEPPKGRRPTATNGQSKQNYDNPGYHDKDYNKENETNIKKETNIDDVFETTEPTGGILHELKRELSRRQSMKEMKAESETSDKKSADSAEGPAFESTPRTSRKANGLSEERGPTNESKYTGIDQQSEVGEPDKIMNPMLRTNPAIRASVSSLRSRTDESPGSKRKKRKKKYVGVHKHPSKGKGDNLENTTDRYDSIPDNSFDSVPPAHSKSDNGPLPPEALAPVFATDTSVMQHFYPPQQDYQNQMNEIVLLGYDAYGNAVYGNPHHYQSGGQNYVIDPHGNYVPLADMSNPGIPGYTSTPYNTYQHHHQMPHGPLATSNLNSININSSIVPSGTVLDDPHIPPPGGTLVRSTVDKKTGAQVNQTVWADSKRDPTDPPPGDHNPQITRKTIVRVTTKDTTDGALPSAPDPKLQEVSFHAAQQLRLQPTEDPSFLSPSKPVRPLTSNGPHTIYASETPERANAAFYSHIQPPSVLDTPKTSMMRDAPAKNHAIRDKIAFSRESEEI